MTGRFLEVTVHISPSLGRTRLKPSTEDVGLSFVDASLRPENSSSEGLGPGPAGHRGWAICTPYPQGSYFHFLKMSLTLSAGQRLAAMLLALESSARCSVLSLRPADWRTGWPASPGQLSSPEIPCCDPRVPTRGWQEEGTASRLQCGACSWNRPTNWDHG